MTIREHLEAIRRELDGALGFEEIKRHADVALAELDASVKTFGKYEGRIIPDPPRADDARELADFMRDS